MILFKKIRWKNFLSTGNVFTELDLNSHKNVLIVGENGAGKSTFLDALSFVLFNKPFRNINKPQLINSITQKSLIVEVEFTISKNNYKIIRGIKPAVFEVYQNDKLLNQSAEMKDYQEILEKQILKINHKSFCQVVVLGSASYTPFMQLPAGHRRDIIEDLLDLQIFTMMNSLLKNKLTDNENNIKDVQNQKVIIEEKIKLIKEHLVDLQRNNAKLIDDKKERIVETEKQIEENNKKLTNIRRTINDLKTKTEDFEALQKRVQKLSKLKHQIEAKLKIINDDVKFFESHDNCPTCKQDIDKQFKCDTINNKNNEINDIQSGLEKLLEEYNNTNDKINSIMEINSQINDKRLEEHKYRTQLDSYENYKQQLIEEIDSINKEPVTNENASKIDDLEAEYKINEKEYTKLFEEKQIYQAAATLLKDGGIKSKIVKQYVPVINKLINKYLSAMDFFVQFELDETFKETIKSRYRDEFSYASFSEGEKFRINLAVLFTWRAIAKLRNSINTNILIMDEVMDSSLDNNGTDEFLKIIANLTSDTNVFIISHKTDTIADKFEKVIKFEKHKNFSRIA